MRAFSQRDWHACTHLMVNWIHSWHLRECCEVYRGHGNKYDILKNNNWTFQKLIKLLTRKVFTDIFINKIGHFARQFNTCWPEENDEKFNASTYVCACLGIDMRVFTSECACVSVPVHVHTRVCTSVCASASVCVCARAITYPPPTTTNESNLRLSSSVIYGSLACYHTSSKTEERERERENVT